LDEDIVNHWNFVVTSTGNEIEDEMSGIWVDLLETFRDE